LPQPAAKATATTAQKIDGVTVEFFMTFRFRSGSQKSTPVGLFTAIFARAERSLAKARFVR